MARLKECLDKAIASHERAFASLQAYHRSALNAAVLAERERCAKVADACAEERHREIATNFTRAIWGHREAKRIAERIRKPTVADEILQGLTEFAGQLEAKE